MDQEVVDVGADVVPDEPASATIRSAYVGLAASLIGAVTAFLAYRTLLPYAPQHAASILAAGMLLWGSATWLVAASSKRWVARVTMLGGAVLVPIALVTWFPGVAQPAEHPIPGAPTLTINAAPDGTFDIYVMPDGDAANLVALTDSGHAVAPELDTQGSALAYSVATASGSDVWLMHLGPKWTVQSQTRIVADKGSVYPEALAPDGRLVVATYASDRSSRLSYLDPATGRFERWMAGSLVEYSPDGRQVVFCRAHAGDALDQDVWVAAADGSAAHRLIDTKGNDTFPHWSPDGQTIAFTSDATGSEDVWTASADGTVPHDITQQAFSSRELSYGWSPEGQVLFLSDRSNTGGTFLYFMAPDGSGVTLALRI